MPLSSRDHPSRASGHSFRTYGSIATYTIQKMTPSSARSPAALNAIVTSSSALAE
jgi:hypothetical protein